MWSVIKLICVFVFLAQSTEGSVKARTLSSWPTNCWVIGIDQPPLQIYYGHSVQWDSKNGNYFIWQGRRGLQGAVWEGGGVGRAQGWWQGWRDGEMESSSGETLFCCVLGGAGIKALHINTITKEEEKKERRHEEMENDMWAFYFSDSRSTISHPSFSGSELSSIPSLFLHQSI